MDIHRCRRVCATPDFHYLGNDDIRVLSLFSISCPEGLNGDEMMYLPMIWGTEERVGCGDSPCGFTCFLETFSWSKSVANCTRVTFVTMDRLNASMPVHSAMTPESGGGRLMNLSMIRIPISAMAVIPAGDALAGASAATAVPIRGSAGMPPVCAAHTAERRSDSTLCTCRSRFVAMMTRMLIWLGSCCHRCYGVGDARGGPCPTVIRHPRIRW